MNNLHRELAPISEEAWTEIEEEVVRTFKRNLAGRRMVDVSGPHGPKLNSVGTGHLKAVKSADSSLQIHQHEIIPLVKLRVPFELSREEIDAVEYGSTDSDWQPAKDAAEKIAFAEDRCIFEGMPSAGMSGLITTSNPVVKLPEDHDDFPEAVAEALKILRLEGVEGPYILALGTEIYTDISGASDDGFPVMTHVYRQLKSDPIWAPAIQGAFLISTRGGDFELTLGRDLSVGYHSHTDAKVKLYLEETLAFRLLSPEAVVAIKPAAASKTVAKKKV